MIPSFGALPIELVIELMTYLSISDRKEAALVCQRWYDASLDSRLQKEIVIIVNTSVKHTRPLTALENRNGFHLALTDIDGSQNSEEALQRCQSHLGPRLLTLSLKGSSVSERSFLSVISKCTNLKALDLSCCNSIVIAGSHLTLELAEVRLPFLESLDLSSIHHLSDATFTAFIGLGSQLRILRLASAPIMYRSSYLYDDRQSKRVALTFDCVHKAICDLSQTLCDLDLSHTRIGDEALISLVSTPGLILTRLVLISTRELSNLGVIKACQMQPNLEELNLAFNIQLTDATLKYIASLTYLVSLNLQKILITDFGVKYLQKLCAVTDLSLSSCMQRDFPKDTLFSPPMRLRKLDISVSASLSDSSLIAIISHHARSLTHLDLTSCLQITNATVHEISYRLRHLRALSIAWCRKVTDSGLLGYADVNGEVQRNCECSDCSSIERNDTVYPLSLLADLQSLNLSMCTNLTDHSIMETIQFSALAYLSLSNCSKLTDEAIISVARHNPLLETVNIEQCQVTDHGVITLIACCRRLAHLNMAGCSGISDRSIDEIVRRGTRLKSINVTRCEVTGTAMDRLTRFIPTLITVHKQYTQIHD